MDLKEFYVNLRRDLLTIISGVKDAKQGWGWDNTTPNYTTQRKLQRLFNHSCLQIAAFGFYVIKRHAGCDNPNHNKLGFSQYTDCDDYIIEMPDGSLGQYKDPKYIYGGQFDNLDAESRCPCSKKMQAPPHYYMLEAIYDSDKDQETFDRMFDILDDVYWAIRQSKDGRPRSGIREYLLRAVLKINDELLPAPMHEYIERQISQNDL